MNFDKIIKIACYQQHDNMNQLVVYFKNYNYSITKALSETKNENGLSTIEYLVIHEEKKAIDFLIDYGVSANTVIFIAIKHTKNDYVRELVIQYHKKLDERGLEVIPFQQFARYILHNNFFTKNKLPSDDQILEFLSDYPPEIISNLIHEFNLQQTNLWRLLDLSKNISLKRSAYNLSFKAASLYFDRDYTEFLYLNMLMNFSDILSPNENTRQTLSIYLLHVGLSLVETPADLNKLALISTCNTLRRALSNGYLNNSIYGFHKERATSFDQQIPTFRTWMRLKTEVARQTQLLQGQPNPYPLMQREALCHMDLDNPKQDKLLGIFTIWNRRLTNASQLHKNAKEQAKQDPISSGTESSFHVPFAIN